MSDAITSLPPASQPVLRLPPVPPADDQPDVPEISFRDLWSDPGKGFGFADLVDIVNPLQHLPVIGSLYRGLTGDQIGLGARLAGGALYGGPLGMFGAVMMAAADQVAGGEPGAQVIAFVRDLFEDGPDASAPQLAAVTPAAGPAAPATAPAALPVDAAHGAAADLTDADMVQAAPPGAVASPAPVAAAAPAATAAPPAIKQPKPAAVVAPVAQGREFPAHPGPRPLTRSLAAPIRPGLGAQRATPAPAAAPGPTARATGDAESQRILAQVQAAQRMQAGLLLASLAGSAPALPSAGGTESRRDGLATGAEASGGTHPFLPPVGASSAWVGRAMEQALNKYQKSQMLHRAPPVPPGRVPLTPQ